MTNRDILNALGDIDESYITEANGRIKSKKGIIIRYSAMAACLLIVAVGAFAAVKMIPRGKIKNSAITNKSYEEYDGNVADYDGDYSTIEKPTALIQTAPPRETARHHRKMKLLMLKDGTKKQTPKNSP